MIEVERTGNLLHIIQSDGMGDQATEGRNVIPIASIGNVHLDWDGSSTVVEVISIAGVRLWGHDAIDVGPVDTRLILAYTEIIAKLGINT